MGERKRGTFPPFAICFPCGFCNFRYLRALAYTHQPSRPLAGFNLNLKKIKISLAGLSLETRKKSKKIKMIRQTRHRQVAAWTRAAPWTTGDVCSPGAAGAEIFWWAFLSQVMGPDLSPTRDSFRSTAFLSHYLPTPNLIHFGVKS